MSLFARSLSLWLLWPVVVYLLSYFYLFFHFFGHFVISKILIRAVVGIMFMILRWLIQKLRTHANTLSLGFGDDSLGKVCFAELLRLSVRLLGVNCWFNPTSFLRDVYVELVHLLVVVSWVTSLMNYCWVLASYKSSACVQLLKTVYIKLEKENTYFLGCWLLFVLKHFWVLFVFWGEGFALWVVELFLLGLPLVTFDGQTLAEWSQFACSLNSCAAGLGRSTCGWFACCSRSWCLCLHPPFGSFACLVFLERPVWPSWEHGPYWLKDWRSLPNWEGLHFDVEEE